MAGLTKSNLYSFTRLQICRVTSTGIPVGQLDPNNLSNDTTSHAYTVSGPITANISPPQFGRVEFRDGSKWQGSANTGIESFDEITIDINAYDAQLHNVLYGYNVDTTTIANTVLTSPGYNVTAPNDIMLILSVRQYSRDSATLGSSKWLTMVIPKCEGRVVFPSLTQDSGTNPSTGQLVIYPKKASTTPVGSALGSNQGFEDNEEIFYTISADYSYSVTSYVQNASTTTYTTAYLPASSDVTSGNTTNLFSVNGTVTAPSSINTSTGVVTLAAAGTAGQVAVAFYQTDFTAV